MSVRSSVPARKRPGSVLVIGSLALAVALAGPAVTLGAHAGAPELAAPPLLAGFAERDVTAPQGTFLGGYGLGTFAGDRAATSSAPLKARAMVLRMGGDAVGVAQVDNQGVFIAYKERFGDVGLLAAAKRAEAATGGGLPADAVILSSSHSHAGPDGIGAWGGVSAAYLDTVTQALADALTQAYTDAEPATLSLGTVAAPELVRSQYHEPPNDVVDDVLRVLVAYSSSDGTLLGSTVTFAAHSTVLGSGNLVAHGDWIGAMAEALQARDGGVHVVLEGAVGRTQPRDGKGELGLPQEATEWDVLDAYVDAVTAGYDEAVASAAPVAPVGLTHATRWTAVVAHNAALLALVEAGGPFGAELLRADTPPYQIGNVLGTRVTALGIGDVLLVSSPGEAYPDIAFGIAAAADARETFLIGLGQDQLGYLIAPLGAYHQPVAGTFVEPDCGTVPADPLDPGCYAPIANDNWAFNVGPLVGEQVKCEGIHAAAAAGFTVADVPPLCNVWA